MPANEQADRPFEFRDALFASTAASAPVAGAASSARVTPECRVEQGIACGRLLATQPCAAHGGTQGDGLSYRLLREPLQSTGD